MFEWALLAVPSYTFPEVVVTYIAWATTLRCHVVSRRNDSGSDVAIRIVDSKTPSIWHSTFMYNM